MDYSESINFDQVTDTVDTADIADNSIVSTNPQRLNVEAQPPTPTVEPETVVTNASNNTPTRQSPVAAEAPEPTVTKLRGDALKTLMDRMVAANASQSDMAKATGWVSKGGRNETQKMWEEYGRTSANYEVRPARKGKEPSNEAGVTKQGGVMVGAAYVKQLGWNHEERVVIKVDTNEGTITLQLKQ